MKSWPYSGHLVLGGDGGRGRGREEPICHLNFSTEVPDLC